MKAKDYNGTIKVYNQVPKSYGNIVGGFDLLSDSELQGHGFYDVVTPTFDNRIKELGDIYFDSENNYFTYPVNNKTWAESLAELKEAKVSEVKNIYGTILAETDWYVIRKQEKNIDIPSDVQTNRDALRTACNTHEAAINALTDKQGVESYDLSNI